MKKTLYVLLTVIIVTFLMYLYVESNYYKGIAEICLDSYHTLEETERALEQGQIYDYLIIYDLYNKENSKVYKGNINILLNGKIKEKTNIELSEGEVLIGDKFVEKNYAYYPLGRKHEFNNKEYRINAVITDSSDIYYTDLSILDSQNIKRQRIYAVLKDKDGVNIYENTFLSILKSSNISPAACVYYDNLSKLLLKIVILLFMVICIYTILKLKNTVKKLINVLVDSYRRSKYDVNLSDYIKQRENFKIVRSIMIYFGVIVVLIICSMFLTVKYMNFKVPYRFNPVSPKSIYSLIKSFFNFVSYYLNNGITEISFIVLKILFIYISVLLFMAAIYFSSKFIKKI